ncbi:SNF2-related protein [Arthrobacter sp. NPDC058192]|uniref:DEAD/DEAH box helicase n=1 Tax=Arthrobacter sp. NPDC058192 TaxID=3346372 RepID=UPI0036E1851C
MTIKGITKTELNVAPGSVVRVMDEDWLVTSVEKSVDGTLMRVQGLSELVRDTAAAFYSALDTIEVVDPAKSKVVADDTPNYRRARLFLETTLRKTPTPQSAEYLTVSTRMLSRNLRYQQIAVAKALDTKNIRPRILIADAVGLGKTLEIGMILSELVKRGRGERILIVTPRHVLEQMQHELWCRFALPFVRLDSAGIQKIRQKLPATRNPFTYYKRAIISMDTLKSPRYRAQLGKLHWDAVVTDEAHNVTNTQAMNNELARVLAPNTEALTLASATPHNGRNESFAEILRLLDPPPSARTAPSTPSTWRTSSSAGTGTAPKLPRKSVRTGPSGKSRTTGSCPPPQRRTPSPRSSPTSGSTPKAGRHRIRARTARCSPGSLPRRSYPALPRFSKRSLIVSGSSTPIHLPRQRKPKPSNASASSPSQPTPVNPPSTPNSSGT